MLANKRAIWSVVGGIAVAALMLGGNAVVAAHSTDPPKPVLKFVAISCPPNAKWTVDVTQGLTLHSGTGSGVGPLSFSLAAGSYTWTATSDLNDFTIVTNAAGTATLVSGTVTVTLVCQPVPYSVPLVGSTVHGPVTTSVVQSIPVGIWPRGVAYDSSNGYVYVTNWLSANVTVINGATNTVAISSIQVGAFPMGIAYDSSDGYVYVANSGSNNVTVINGATNTVVVPSISVGEGPSGVAFDSSNGYVYVTNGNLVSGNVTVINGATNTVVVPSIPVGVEPNGVAFDSSNGYVYVTNYGSNNVTVINGATNTVVVPSITVGTRPYGVAFDSWNGYVYVTNYGSSNLTVIEGGTVVVHSIPVWSYPDAAAFDSSNGYVFVTQNTSSDNVSVIDGTTNTVVVPSIPVGAAPWDDAFDSSNGCVYVSNARSGAVTVIGCTLETLNSTTARPWGEAFDAVNNCVYVTEDPSTPSTMGYVTAWGPSFSPQSYPIPQGDNPQGIAWAPSFAWEPSTWTTSYRGGVLEVADSGSNAISVFGIPYVPGTTGHPAAPGQCGVVWLQTDYVTNSVATPGGQSLQDPWDVVFASIPGFFYVTWAASSAVTAMSGSNLVCETTSGLSNPEGLSYNGAGAINVANNQSNGWVTQIPTKAFPYCGSSTTSSPVLDEAVWTVSAPSLAFNNSSVIPTKNVVAVSDSNYGTSGNLVGDSPINTGTGGCYYGTPVGHVMGELNAVGLGCSDSVLLDGATPVAPPSPGAYGNAFSTWTHRVYEVLDSNDNSSTPSLASPGGTLEAVTWSAVYETISTQGTQPIDVIWFVPGTGTYATTGATSFTTPYYNAPAGDGTLVVTNWGSGSLLVSPTF
jgi:YVTN family beta-propeller protein